MAQLRKACQRGDAVAAMRLIQTSSPDELGQVDDEGNTPLMFALIARKAGDFEMEEVALALIATGHSHPERANQHGNTALVYACVGGMEVIVLALIATGQSSPATVDNLGNTPLMMTCDGAIADEDDPSFANIALALIATGQSHPEQVNRTGCTALMNACVAGESMEQVALALIATGQSHPEQVNSDGETALIMACEEVMLEVVLALINTGQSHPEHVSPDGDTALLKLFGFDEENTDLNEATAIALALIATGQSRPEQANMFSANALMLACICNMSEVALALIATGQSHPEQINYTGYTSLIRACYNKMEQVALALIATGQSRPEQIDPNGNTALKIAKKNKMKLVVAALKPQSPSSPLSPLPGAISVNQMCYNFMELEDVRIRDFLVEDASNIVFVIISKTSSAANIVLGINRSFLKKNNAEDVVLECLNNEGYLGPGQINREVKYFDIKKAIGFADVVTESDVQKVLKDTSSRAYALVEERELLSTITQGLLSGRHPNLVGARHCRSDDRARVYAIKTMELVDDMEETKEETKQEETKAGGTRRRKPRKTKKHRCKTRPTKRKKRI